MRTILVQVALLLSFLSALLPLRSAWSEERPLPQVAGIEVRDSQGHLLHLDHAAQRIVSLAPHATEMLFAIGAGERVVGVIEGSDYPAAALKLPLIGSYQAVDFERILALQPDLVVAWGSGNGARQVERLRALGLHVYVSEPRRLADIADDLERLGRLTGLAQGQREAEQLRSGIADLRAQFQQRAPVRVFYQVWDRPLMTVNGQHLISHVIELCGGRNIFADLQPLAAEVSVEAVVARDPQAIVSGSERGQRSDWEKFWRDYAQIAAVRQGHFISIDADLLQRQSPRVLQGARQLCEKLQQVRTAQQTGP